MNLTEILPLISKLTSNKEITIVCGLTKEAEVDGKRIVANHYHKNYHTGLVEYNKAAFLRSIEFLDEVIAIPEYLENSASFNFVLTKKPSKLLSDINSLENSQSCRKYTSENLIVNFIGKQNI